MNQLNLCLYNTLKKKKELFKPLSDDYISIYVCGPTVYSHSHLGHARSAIIFDILHRYLKFHNKNVKYIRNITDVGHLENDIDEGEDKMIKRAHIEQLSVMELTQKYLNSYHEDLKKLNILSPSIEPLASGHITEQISFIKKIISKGFGYVVNGSVYFDLKKYNKYNKNKYGVLSNRNIDELLKNTRNLKKQLEKKSSLDFALWKKADDKHILRWPSPWGDGFPGWHIECSSMSEKYLGHQFDIHGGGLDLCFPHHECEIAQSFSVNQIIPARYWVHNNMVTINGQKMSKSLNNFITLKDLFLGNHPLIKTKYSPMALRFFILQAHYRSTLDFSREALDASKKGFMKLLNAHKEINNMASIKTIFAEKKNKYEFLNNIYLDAFKAMDNDLNTAQVIASMNEMAKYINIFSNDHKEISNISEQQFNDLKFYFNSFFEKILGFKNDIIINNENLINIILKKYLHAKKNKNYDIVNEIRNDLKENGVNIEDRKSGISWKYSL